MEHKLGKIYYRELHDPIDGNIFILQLIQSATRRHTKMERKSVSLIIQLGSIKKVQILLSKHVFYIGYILYNIYYQRKLH